MLHVMKSHIIQPEMLPELLLLGELEQYEAISDNGNCVMVTAVMYEGRRYIMKEERCGRWFGTADEMGV
jgi:hypothetical protein